MDENEKIKLLAIYTGETEKYNFRPLYEAIVYAAKKSGLAGATVIRGIMSYGANSKVHTAKIFALSNDLPVKIEIIDTEEKLRKFIEVVKKMFAKSASAGIITLKDVEVIMYQSSKK
jgi:PII-like signaling protein